VFININENYEITRLMTVGGDPDNPENIYVENIPYDIMSDIFSYKYINGQFVRKQDTDYKHANEAKQEKISFLSKTCRSVIESGIQYGDDHYSLTETDQINLSKLATQAMSFPQIPIFYHADGQLCRQYTPEEILTIAQLSVNWVTYHTTYNNFAKAYIKTLSSFEQICVFQYGDELSPDLQEQMEAITSTTGVVYTDKIEDPYDYDRILHPEKSIITV